MQYRIFHRAVTESTNLDAREGVAGDVFTADEQTAGRGRLDHRWLSPPRANLMMSVVLDVADLPPERVVTLPLVVGLAVHAAVSGFITGRVSIKWPNDVLVEGRKIAGILCERHGNNVIAGIGVNVNQTVFAPEIAARATSLACACGNASSVAEVRDRVLAELSKVHEVWRTHGFEALQARFAEVDELAGRHVVVRQTDDDAAPIEGVCAGVQADGTLLVGAVRVFAGEAHVMRVEQLKS